MLRALVFLLVMGAALILSELRPAPGENHPAGVNQHWLQTPPLVLPRFR